MILPSLNGRWDKTGKDKPRIRILEVRPRTRPDEDPIAWILVEREEMLEWDRDNTALMRASLRLSFAAPDVDAIREGVARLVRAYGAALAA